jgi:Flp pilus assembly protein TadG
MTSPLRSHRGQRRRPRSRGQALVEFALVIPLFLLLLAGMIDFGIGLYSYMTVQNAARDGARLGATACSAVPCTAPITARVLAASGLNPTVTVVCRAASNNAVVPCSPKLVSPPTAGVQKGDSITVTADYTYRMIWPLTFGTQIPMTANVTFMAE